MDYILGHRARAVRLAPSSSASAYLTFIICQLDIISFPTISITNNLWMSLGNTVRTLESGERRLFCYIQDFGNCGTIGFKTTKDPDARETSLIKPIYTDYHGFIGSAGLYQPIVLPGPMNTYPTAQNASTQSHYSLAQNTSSQ